MAKHATPEADATTAQLTLLRQIDGGADWHTAIGQYATIGPRGEHDPQSHIFRSSVETESDGSVGGILRVTWRAMVRITDDEDMLPEQVLSDMRAALFTKNLFGAPSESAASITSRDSGGEFAVVDLTVQQYAITR